MPTMKTETTRDLIATLFEVARIAIATQHKLSILESVIEEESPRLYLAYRETLAARPEPGITMEELESRLTQAA